MGQPIEAVLVGAGNRGGDVYGAYALDHPDEIRFVAVAEPIRERRERFAKAHSIPPERQYESWEDMLAEGQLAPALVCATMDSQHLAPTVAALEAGYHVLLEKPMATTLADSVRLVQVAERTGRILQICHVLRYTDFFTKVHDIVRSGRLGRVITVEHRENVSYWHMGHSFVRGHWRNSELESPMILAKCCHDFDLLYWILGRKVKRLQSFGSLIHFRPENAPGDVPERCTDGCEFADECPWYAPRLYLGDWTGWPVSTISEDLSLEGRRRALETGPYGRCVYRCDNDVVDHQTVNMELEDGTTVVLFMHGHSHEEGRTMRYDGTRATLIGRFGMIDSRIEIHDHLTGEREVIEPEMSLGHGGGDEGLMAAFVRAVRNPDAGTLTSARDSLESHLLAFAAERSRVEGTIIDMGEFRAEAERTTD